MLQSTWKNYAPFLIQPTGRSNQCNQQSVSILSDLFKALNKSNVCAANQRSGTRLSATCHLTCLCRKYLDRVPLTLLLLVTTPFFAVVILGRTVAYSTVFLTSGICVHRMLLCILTVNKGSFRGTLCTYNPPRPENK